MPEVERSNWQASGRNGYTAVDRFRGSKCQEFIERFNSQKNGDRIAQHLNRAYQRGREEMMEELAALFAQEGGQFYINQMLMAANGPSDPVIITRMVTERVDIAPANHEPKLGCCAEHFNASPGNPESI